MVRTDHYLYNYDMRERPWNVRVNSCGRMTCAPDWSWDTAPGLADYDLIAILKGRGEYRWPGGALPARAGSCLLLRKGGRYLGSMDPADPMTVVWVHFDYLGRSGKASRPAGRSLPALHRSLENPGFLHALLDRLLEAFRGDSGTGADFWLKAALLELLRQDARPRRSGHELEQARAVEELCARVRRRPGGRWRLADLAGALYCTPDHFGRLFRKYVGVSPGEFVLRARIDAAMGLLRSSSHSVTRIAELLGYGDVYAFSRQFKEKTGSAPTSYRRGATGRS